MTWTINETDGNFAVCRDAGDVTLGEWASEDTALAYLSNCYAALHGVGSEKAAARFAVAKRGNAYHVVDATGKTMSQHPDRGAAIVALRKRMMMAEKASNTSGSTPVPSLGARSQHQFLDNNGDGLCDVCNLTDGGHAALMKSLPGSY